MSILDRIFARGRGGADRLIAQGNQAESAGDLGRAKDFYRQALALAPDYPKAHVNLGITLEALGDIPGAVACYEKALAANTRDPYANYNLGKLRYAQRALPQAEQLLLRALEARPDFREARVLLGCVRLAQGQVQSALQGFEAALRQDSRDLGTLYNYALALRAAGRLAEAQAALKQALTFEPKNADVHAALADVRLALGDSAGALSALEAVLAERPDWADALYNYGVLQKRQKHLAQAEEALRRALAVSPAHAKAARMLGAVLLGQGRIEETLEIYAAARKRSPEDFALESAELFALLCSDRVTEEQLYVRHVAFGRRLEQAYPRRSATFGRRRDPSSRLRIGYLSADFCYHVISLSMLPVLERHDRSAYEVYCYSTTQSPDDYTRRLAERAEVWRPCAGLPEDRIASAIADDQIDILVDLAGHSGDPQLSVMARRPAPVQATWIGYLHSTGLTRIDYRITDATADPPGLTERYHTEALARLPHAQWCWRPFLSLPHAASPPCLKNGHVTFGSFHGAMKLSPSVRALWAQILEQLPESRLVLLGVPAGPWQETLLKELRVLPERVTLVPYVSLEDYLRWYSAVDIVLDTSPYSGATTTCDALYMGAPVITAPATRSASRSAASVLRSVGLDEWIASSPQDYVRLAVAYADNTEMLAALRGSLRERLRASSIMDEERFVRDLEGAYRRMWQQWCAGRDPVGW